MRQIEMQTISFDGLRFSGWS